MNFMRSDDLFLRSRQPALDLILWHVLSRRSSWLKLKSYWSWYWMSLMIRMKHEPQITV